MGGLHRTLESKRTRLEELTRRREEAHSAIATLREDHGRVVADGQDARVTRRRIREAEEEVDGLERAIEHLEREISEVTNAVHQEDLERTRVALDQQDRAYADGIANFRALVDTFLSERLLPELASLEGELYQQRRQAEGAFLDAARAAGAGDPWRDDPRFFWRDNSAWSQRAPDLQNLLVHLRFYAERRQIVARAGSEETPRGRTHSGRKPAARTA